MVEMLVVAALVSTFTFFYIPIASLPTFDYHTWPYRYLETQTKAILYQTPQMMEDVNDASGPLIGFNDRGNVRKAMTVPFREGNIVIELGGGHLVFQ